MGINVQHETETDEVLDTLLDPNSLLVRLVTNEQDEGVCLRFIDSYGDTIFNQAQIPVLIREIHAAIERSTDEEINAHASKVLDLIKKADGELHTYIRFIGD